MNRTIKYLDKKADLERWKLVSSSQEKISQVVVIPSLAEEESLFDTLQSLASNPASELDHTLVIVVVNNRAIEFHDNRIIENNQATLRKLDNMAGIKGSALHIGYIDASSDGKELPPKTGVGLARKIGLDWGLSTLDQYANKTGLLLCLDADTLVEPNYLEAVRSFFEYDKAWAGVVSYKHRNDGPDQTAIICYELFLRYYVLGLQYARSPYAFHSIGSTMVCTTDAYVAVSGMNRRQAAEDFYFLQELAKTGGVGHITDTCVFPSSRISSRVPFGTGVTMDRYADHPHDMYSLYDSQCFQILRNWLELISAKHHYEGIRLLDKANAICPQLGEFLQKNRFQQVWDSLVQNSPDSKTLLMQFHRWFDAFKTMKFIHYMRDNGFPRQNMSEAIPKFLDMTGRSSMKLDGINIQEDLNSLKKILNNFRNLITLAD